MKGTHIIATVPSQQQEDHLRGQEVVSAQKMIRRARSPLCSREGSGVPKTQGLRTFDFAILGALLPLSTYPGQARTWTTDPSPCRSCVQGGELSKDTSQEKPAGWVNQRGLGFFRGGLKGF